MSTGYLASVSRKSRVVTVDFPHPAQKEVRRSLKVFPNIEYLAADVIPTVQDMLDGGDIPQFIHIAHTSLWRQIVEMVLPYATPDMVIVVDDLGKKPKKEWWSKKSGELLEIPFGMSGDKRVEHLTISQESGHERNL